MNGAQVRPDVSSSSSSSLKQHHICSRFLKKNSPDVYGQKHAIESSKCIIDSLRLLEKEIYKLPDDLREGLDQAVVYCPEIAESIEHRLMFLRCEQFNVDLAAIRLAKYWNMRIHLFQGAAFRPLLSENMGSEEREALSIGFLSLLPDPDGTGRCNIYVDPCALEGKKYGHEGMVKAAWYILHDALETESTQQKGVVFLVYLRGALLRHFDRKLIQHLTTSIRGILPVRVSGIHMFHAPYLFEVMFDVIALMLGERLTKRMKMYSDEEDDVIHEKLNDFGIIPSRLPTALGGSIEFCDGKWKQQETICVSEDEKDSLQEVGSIESKEYVR